LTIKVVYIIGAGYSGSTVAKQIMTRASQAWLSANLGAEFVIRTTRRPSARIRARAGWINRRYGYASERTHEL
jgi:cation diffusion facilitator CzcD-associated flavoprotein CzcO